MAQNANKLLTAAKNIFENSNEYTQIDIQYLQYYCAFFKSKIYRQFSCRYRVGLS